MAKNPTLSNDVVTMNPVDPEGAADFMRPEWVRVPDAVRLFGLSRSAVYELIADEKVVTVSLRKRGKRHGIRLISFESLNAFIHAAISTKGVRKDGRKKGNRVAKVR